MPKLPEELGGRPREAVGEEALAREEPLGVFPPEAPDACCLRCSGEEARDERGVPGG